MNQRLYCVVFFEGKRSAILHRRDWLLTYGRGNIARRVEEDGHVDESDPARGVSPVEGVDDTGYDGLRQEVNQRFRDRVSGHARR